MYKLRKRPHAHIRKYESGKRVFVNPQIPKSRRVEKEVIFGIAKDFLIAKITNENFDLSDSLAKNTLKGLAVNYVCVQTGLPSSAVAPIVDLMISKISEGHLF